jgi:hypothetical protein
MDSAPSNEDGGILPSVFCPPRFSEQGVEGYFFEVIVVQIAGSTQ